MRPEAGSHSHSDRVSESQQVDPPALTEQLAAPQLDAEQSQVLACLAQAGGGLTITQLESLLPSCAAVETALDRLLERRLVSRFNTVIPSYACRRPDAGVYDA